MKKILFSVLVIVTTLLSCSKQKNSSVSTSSVNPISISEATSHVDYSKITESFINTGGSSTSETKMINYLDSTYGGGYVEVYNQIKNDSRFKKSISRLDNSDGVVTKSEIVASVNELNLSEYGSNRLVEFYSLLDNEIVKLDSLYNVNKALSIDKAKKIVNTYRQSLTTDYNLIESEKNGILIAIKVYEDNIDGIVNYFENSISSKVLRTEGLTTLWRQVKTVALSAGIGAAVGIAIGLPAGGAGGAIGAAVGGGIGLIVGVGNVATNNCFSNKCPGSTMDCKTSKCK